MPMRVLGKCMRRYQNFSNDHDAMVDRVILTNRTFFGGPKDWSCDTTGDRCASYNEIAKKSDPIMKNFHEKLCEKITQATTVWSCLAIMRGVHARIGSLPRKETQHRCPFDSVRLYSYLKGGGVS
jgi:hypothetical protein